MENKALLLFLFHSKFQKVKITFLHNIAFTHNIRSIHSQHNDNKRCHLELDYIIFCMGESKGQSVQLTIRVISIYYVSITMKTPSYLI